MKIRGGNLLINKGQLVFIISVISVIISAGGYFYYRFEENVIREQKHNELKAIANLKADEISEWYKDEIYDAQIIAKQTHLFKPFLINHTFANNRDEKIFRTRLNELTDEHGYENILLSDTTGKLLFSLQPKIKSLDSKLTSLIKSSKNQDSIVFTDLYFCSEHNKVHLDVISPILNENNKILGLLILRVEPENYLFPLIQSWPTPSKTAETILVRKEGNYVVFINKLRHFNNTPLTYRISQSKKYIPAVKAIQGLKGIYEGIDYRGVKVLSEILRVNGTPWYMISKVDQEEIFSELNYRAVFIGIFTFVLILLFGFGLSWIYHYRQKNIYKELFLKEKKLFEKELEYRTTLYSIGEGVITTDINGNIKQMNPVAEQLTGWAEKEAKGLKLEKVFNIICEHTSLKLENPLLKDLSEVAIASYTPHTLLISKTGTHVPIAESSAPIKTKDGLIIGSVLVFRDRTDEREAEKKLCESEERNRALLNANPDLMFILDNNGIFIDYKSGQSENLYASPDLFLFKQIFEVLPFELAKQTSEFIELLFTTGKNQNFEYQLNVGNQVKHFDNRLVQYGENKVLSIARDITEKKATEEALRKSEKRYYTLANISPVGIFHTDKEGFTTYVNPQWTSISGLSEEEALGFGWLKAVHPEDRTKRAEGWDEVTKSQRADSAEYRFVQPDGRVTWVLGNAVPEINSYNQIVGYVGTITDITERKIAEEALRESEERFRTILENVPNVAVRGYTADGKIRYWNRACELVYGYTAQEAIGANLFDLIIPVNRMDFYKQRINSLFEGGCNLPSSELSFIKKDGSPVHVYSSRSMICKPNHEMELFSIDIDLTELKRAEENVRKLFRGIEQSPAAVVITDEQGRIEYVNPKFAEITGYNLQLVSGKIARILKQGSTSNEKFTEIWKTINSGKEWSGEFKNKKNNGEFYWESVSISPIVNESGETTNFILITEDSTERKKMIEELIIAKEEAVMADKLKSEFLAQMSHEIRTPLNTVLNYTSLLKEEYPSQNNNDITNIFQAISNASRRVIRTIDLILNISQITTNVYDYRPKKIDIYTDIIYKVNTELNQTAAAKGLILRIKKLTEDTQIITDEYSVSQIFINIVENAIKYTKVGFVEMRILKNERNQLQVEVEDSGVGMSQQYMSKIFTPFSQEETGYTRRYEGTGLGLSLVKKYCELNKALIHVTSNKNVGTTFTIIFPN